MLCALKAKNDGSELGDQSDWSHFPLSAVSSPAVLI